LYKAIACSGFLIVALGAFPLPAVADPCLSRETIEHIQRRLGQVGALAFAAGTGLGLCQDDYSGARQYEILQSVQRVDQLSASADMYTEQLSCPSSASTSSGSGGFNLVPGEVYGSGPTKNCSCSQYRQALREAQAALRRLAR